MKVRRGRKALHVAIAIALSTGGLIFFAESTAQAADFTSAPERLYMVPANIPLADLEAFATNAAIPALAGIPIGTLEFGGSGTDPISGDPYKITVNTVNGNAGCDLTQSPYDIDDCSRLQLSGVQSGRISMGPITTITDGRAPGVDVYQLPSGAVIDNLYQVAAGSYSLGVNGTPEQLQAALDDLVYTPDDGYYYAAGPADPEILNIVVVPGNSDDPDPTPDPNTSDSIDIDIRVLKINGFPSHDGPDTKPTQQPGIELVMTDEFTAADADNDEDVDGAQADPPVSEDPLPDGANTSMLLIGWLTCGQPIQVGTGFHFGSSTFQLDDPSVDDLFRDILEPAGVPSTYIDAALALLEGIKPGLSTLTFATSQPTDYTTAFGGVSTMSEIQAALSDVRFRHMAQNDTCELVTVVSDLGNNGLPLQYVGSPPTGVEIPFIGFDWNVLTIGTGAAEEIDISFDLEPLVVIEGDPGDSPVVAEVPMKIDPATHPAFQIGWEANPKSGDPVGIGEATPNVDFAGTFNNSPLIPQDATTVTSSVDLALNLPSSTVFVDDVDEGNETFLYRILPDAFTAPDGFVITSNTPTRTVVIIDDDDAPSAVIAIADESSPEGDPGNPQFLTFTLELDKPADGTESVSVAVVPGSADMTDYGPPSVTTVTFDPLQTSTTVTVPIVGDLTDEPNENLTLQLSNPQNLTLGDDSAQGTIVNDDQPRMISIGDVSQAEGDGPGTTLMTFTLSITPNSKGGESVTVNTAPGLSNPATAGVDFTALNDVDVLFLPNASSATVSVMINGDTDTESDEQFTMMLGPAVNASVGDPTASGTIVNDDGVPAASISDASVVEGDLPGTAQLNFTVSLSVPAIAPSSVVVNSDDFSATAPSDFAAVVGQLVSFGVGEDSKQVSVTINGDNGGEFDETFDMLLSTPTGLTIADGTGVGTITNDDLDVSFVAQAPNTEGAPLSIVVQVWPPVHPAFGVNVNVLDGSASLGTDYFAFTGNPLEFPPNASGSDTVQTVEDFDFEPTEQFTATLTPAVTPVGFTVRWVGLPAELTILDDDPQSVVSIADAITVEGGASNQVIVSMTNDLPRVCNVELTTTPVTASVTDFTALMGAPLMVDDVSGIL